MAKITELIVTDSYYKVFDILTDKLAGKTDGITGRNVIFCEEKISLMAERAVCERFGGTFNTDVYSFSNYLKSRKAVEALSREGSAMAVRRVINDIPLSVLSAGKTNIAPALFDIIVQLKSASVSETDLADALDYIPEVKRGKLKDIAAVLAAYEKFIKERGFIDQSSVMNYLPAEIAKDESLKGARVFLIGYNSWTAQARRAVLSLVKTAEETTAILTGGDNKFLFVNETAEFFAQLCKDAGTTLKRTKVSSYDAAETRLLSEGLFNPLKQAKEKTDTEKVKIRFAETPEREARTIVGYIADKVKNGARYRDFTVALPDVSAYGKYYKYYFSLYGVPYFIDEKFKPECHPLVRLIYSYFDVKRKKYERSAVVEFFKNPLFCDDKKLTDFMENYLVSFNVNFDAILKPFTLGDDLEKAENFRKELVSVLSATDIFSLLKILNVKEKTEKFTVMLKDAGETVQAEVNAQVYDAVNRICDDMERILSGVDLSFTEKKNVFKSGVSAMELAVIPQFSDAVYVGDYRKTALAKAKYLFAPALTSSVPAVIDDVALISDDDIESLKVRFTVDPTVKIVNRRAKENFGVALLAFSDKLFMSMPEVDGGGKKTAPSEAIKFALSAFCAKTYGFDKKYVAEKEAVYRFAQDCEAYSEKILSDISDAAAFYTVCDDPVKDDILRTVKREIKVRLKDFDRDLFTETSPTKIEDFYKCPYKAFARRILKLGDREDGGISAISVGNLMHEIFREYFKNCSAAHDKESSDALFSSVAKKVLEKPEYKKFTYDGETEELLGRVLSEAENYCYKSLLNLNRTSFVPDKFEYKVNYVLPKSGVKLTGNVDRVDRFGDGESEYLRIIDYKTGKIDEDDNLLYAGVKLQLYLYAAAFYERGNKISGLYYAPVKEEYLKEDKKNRFIAFGKTLNDEKSLAAQHADGENIPVFADDIKAPKGKKEKSFSEEVIGACIKYAVKICDKAVKEMKDGVIIASPYKGECDYCPLKAMCGTPFGESVRKVEGMTGEKIAESAKIADGEE